MMKREVDFNKLRKSPPRCPLCLTPMELQWDSVRGIEVFACHKDEIKIAVTDPMVGRWEEKREKVPCPLCDTNMRVFFTSVGYMRGKCPKKSCGAVIKTSNAWADRKMAPSLKLDGVGDGHA